MGKGGLPVFDEGQLKLLEGIFKKLRKPDAQTIYNTAMEMQISSQKVWEWFRKRRIKENLYATVLDSSLKTKNTGLNFNTFYCLYCKKKISPFKHQQKYEYNNHLKTYHQVICDFNVLYLINFMNKEKKTEIINQAKKVVVKGDFLFVSFAKISQILLLETSKSSKNILKCCTRFHIRLELYWR